MIRELSLKRLAGLLVVLVGQYQPAAALELSPAFSDHMVLQCDLPLRVSGRAEPGEKITVEFGAARGTTTANAQGQWSLELPPQKANADPQSLRVTGKSTIELQDVLVGEVWFCAGQSNMEWPLAREAHANQTLPSAGNPQLRLLDRRFVTRFVFGTPFTVEQRAKLTAEKSFTGNWQRSTPQTAKEFSAIGYYFGRELQQRLNVPVGMIAVAVGGSPTEAWMRREAIAADVELKALVAGNWLENPKLGPWCRERGHQNVGPNAATFPGDDLGPNHPFKPTFLWQSAVAPLLPLTVRGVLWHQGESNSLESWRVEQHARLFPRLVTDWREQFGQLRMPFLFCQLSSIGTKAYQSQFWPEFRDQQRRMAQSIDRCGMVVTSDVGHPTDVHPRDKQTVAKRLTCAALDLVYGQACEFRGPMPSSAEANDGAVRIVFAHAGKGLATSDKKPAASFELAGADRKFHPATAEILGRSVQVRSNDVAEPRFIRYGWQPYSQGNLTDSAGLPASTFEIPVTLAN